jgi:hypothetical protein
MRLILVRVSVVNAVGNAGLDAIKFAEVSLSDLHLD